MMAGRPDRFTRAKYRLRRMSRSGEHRAQNDKRLHVTWLRGLLVLTAIAALGLALFLSPLRRYLDPVSALAQLRALSGSPWAIPLYVLAYAILDVLFIPTQFLSIAAVLMWGWAAGGTIELFSATFGAILPWLIARTAMREWVVERLRTHDRIAELLDREGFTLLLVLRVIPIIPYTALNYVAGFSSIRPLHYVAATFLGMIPSTFIFAYFVDAVAQGVMRPREVVVRAAVAGVLFVALVVGTRLAAPRLRRRVSSPANTTSPTDGADRS